MEAGEPSQPNLIFRKTVIYPYHLLCYYAQIKNVQTFDMLNIC